MSFQCISGEIVVGCPRVLKIIIINTKKYRAHKFYFTISSAVSSIPLHSRGEILPFSWAENPRPPSPVWTTNCGVRRHSGKNCLVNSSKQIGLVESRTYAIGWTSNVTAAVTANVRRILAALLKTYGRSRDRPLFSGQN